MPGSTKRSPPTCARCGGDDLVPGRVHSHYGVSFRPDAKRWFRSGAEIRATACMGCGELRLHVDAGAVDRALGRPSW